MKKDTKFSVVQRPCPCNEEMRKISKRDSETLEINKATIQCRNSFMKSILQVHYSRPRKLVYVLKGVMHVLLELERLTIEKEQHSLTAFHIINNNQE